MTYPFIDMTMTLKFSGSTTPGVYAISTIWPVKGPTPCIGKRYIFQMPLASEEGCVWMNGCMEGRVVDIADTVERALVVSCHVELEPIRITFEQFQEVARAPWLKNFGWRVTEESLG